MNVPAILEALEDCPGLIAWKLTDGKGSYCVLGWLMFKAGKPLGVIERLDRFDVTPTDDACHSLVTFNNRYYRSRKARLEAVRGYVAAQGEGRYL